MNAGWQPPLAARRGDYVYTSTLTGVAADGTLAPDAATQLREAFAKIPVALATVGARIGDVVSIGVAITDHAIRAQVDEPYLALFPDPRTRPARRTTCSALPAGQLVQVTASAVVGGARQTFDVPGLVLEGSVPSVSRAGNILVSSTLDGRDPATGQLVPGSADQIVRAYQNAKLAIEAAGGTTDDIVHFWVFLKVELDIDTLVEKWLEVFPNDGDRPARKTFLDADMPGEDLVHIQFTAVLGGERTNFEVPGVHHRDPIPMGARVGNIFMTSGVFGIAPDMSATTQMPPPPGLEPQLHHAFTNLNTMLAEQGGSLANVAHIGVLAKHEADYPAILDAIGQRFAPGSAPAVHFWGMGMPSPTFLVQLYATAVW